ncbi:MAG: glycosyltransferase family 9 protein [Rhodospirillaceae bacterium]|jgi:ADP-heptose:LPS heptosyltransferase|nr:glycosyltransferase family 9 protein [Rhodospirillaceae bacterium]
MAAESAASILVIKLGALGDMVLALGPFAAIRRHHPDARITLLTTQPYEEFLRASPYFDDIWIDRRPSLLRMDQWLALRSRLRGGRFDRVYDLQTSDRSGWYFRLMGPGPRPQWSGIAPGCSHPHANPGRDFMHSIERQNEQLKMAGIDDVPDADLSWVAGDISRFVLAEPYALMVPGGAPHRPAKRWPESCYGDLAGKLATDGIQSVILGTKGESGLAHEIGAACKDALDLTGHTDLGQIAALARRATIAIGNDTGPMHLIAAAACPSVVLFSADSDYTLTAPRGPAVTVLQRNSLAELPVDEVAAALRLR